MLERWTEIKPILAELMSLDDQKQSTRLGRINDPALRREIANLLSLDDSQWDVLRSPLAHLLPGACH